MYRSALDSHCEKRGIYDGISSGLLNTKKLGITCIILTIPIRL